MSDFFRPVILSARADNATIAATQQVLIKATQTLPWLPNLTGESSSLFFGSPAKYPRLNPDPDGLTDTQKKQWKMVWDALSPITSLALRGEMARAAQDGERLARAEAFWDGVHRVTAAVATVGGSEITPLVQDKWGEMVGLIKEWDDTRTLALRIADHPDCPPDKSEALKKRLAELDASIVGKVASLTAQVPGIKDALKQEGLSGIPAALKSIATIKSVVLLATIAAVAGIIVYCVSSIKQIINDLGLQAIGEAVRAGQKALGPWLGIGIFGLVGFIIYRKFFQKTK